MSYIFFLNLDDQVETVIFLTCYSSKLHALLQSSSDVKGKWTLRFK